MWHFFPNIKVTKKQVKVAVILKKPHFLGHFFVFWAILVHHLYNLAFLNNFDPVLNRKLYKVWYLSTFLSLNINRKKRAGVVPFDLICHLKQLCDPQALRRDAQNYIFLLWIGDKSSPKRNFWNQYAIFIFI